VTFTHLKSAGAASILRSRSRLPISTRALGQLVAQPLQLSQVENPRLGRDRLDPVANLDPAESLGEEAGELALEMADLAPQLDAGVALVDLDVERHQAVSFEQIRHRPGYESRSRGCRRKPGNG